MEIYNSELRRRKNNITLKDLEEDNGQAFDQYCGDRFSQNNINNGKQELDQIVVGSFEDHQVAQEAKLACIVPGKVFPKEIWFEIIDYLDFNDQALLYFFAPIMGVTKKQAEQMAFAINNFVIKNASNFEDVDIKLKNILRIYHKKARELILNYITLLDLSFDGEYKNLKYSVGLLPIRWLLHGPSNVRNSIENLKKEWASISDSCYEFELHGSGLSGFMSLKIRDNIDNKNLNSLKKIYSKIKKRNLMNEHFGSKKYKKVLEKYRENIIRNGFILLIIPIMIGSAIYYAGYFKLGGLILGLGIIYMQNWWYMSLDENTLIDKAFQLENWLDYVEKLIGVVNKKLNKPKDKLKNATN